MRGHTNTVARKSHKLFKASLVTKRYLPRVCKAWYAIASPYLYEQVCTGRGRCLASLCYALKRSRILSNDSSTESESKYSLGWWTRRLDVSFRDFDPNIHDLELLADIIEELPNLTSIVFSVSAITLRDASLPTRILNALGRCLNLKTVHWFQPLLCPDIGDWIHFLTTVTSLSTIGASAHWAVSSLPYEQRPNINLTSVTTYLVDSFSYILFSRMNMSMNNLQHLIFDVGQQHKHLELCWYFIEDFSLEDIIDMFAKSCPQLTSLQIITLQWSCLSFNRFPPSIQKLGLQCTAVQLFWILRDLLRLGEGLQLIQLIDSANAAQLYKHPFAVQNGVRLILGSKVQVLDHEGQDIRCVNYSRIT
ncbi:hypothetical protein BDQ17DRAFT_1366280 [Cyathus striatus]|nr:hypothetical protein BDQ17DRAFT_1366280 [Cyathus striatus]